MFIWLCILVYMNKIKRGLSNFSHYIVQIYLFLIYKKGCNRAGVYGFNCEIPCPNKCKYNTCHIQNGNCLGCQPGWTGTVCYPSTLIYCIYYIRKMRVFFYRYSRCKYKIHLNHTVFLLTACADGWYGADW